MGRNKLAYQLVAVWLLVLVGMDGLGNLFHLVRLSVTATALLEEIIMLVAVVLVNQHWLGIRIRWQTVEPFGVQVRVNTWPILMMAFLLTALVARPSNRNQSLVTTGLLVVTALLVAIFEETLFRGILLGGFLQWLRGRGGWQIWLAVGVSSLLFASSHLINLSHQSWTETLAQVAMAFGLGLLQSATYLRTGSLIWPILLHFVIDMEVLVRTGLIQAVNVPAWAGLVPMVMYGIVALILLRKSQWPGIMKRFNLS